MKKSLLSVLLIAAGAFSAPSVMAAPVIYNLSLSNIATFDNAIAGTGSTVALSKVVQGVSTYNYIDRNNNPAFVTVNRLNGGASGPYSTYSNGGQSLSGYAWDISPSARVSDPIPGFNSGLRFTFSSPVNAFGFEIGDWATCCTATVRNSGVVSTYNVPRVGSGLWIGFDGGALTLPANATSANDNPGYASSRSFTNFIGAIDSSGFFTSVTFFGDGFGEYLLAGGTLRFASVPQGSIGVPEPASIALFGLGLVGLASLRRRKSA